MRILHYQHMGAGVIIASAQRKLGHESRVLATSPHPFGFKEDYLLTAETRNQSTGKYSTAKRILPTPARTIIRKILRYKTSEHVVDLWKPYYDNYDILHSHDNNPLPSAVRKHWKGRMIQHYHSAITTKPIYSDIPSFVSVPTILRKIPDATWIPLPVETEVYAPSFRYKRGEGPIRVGYCNQSIDPTKTPYIPRREIEVAIDKTNRKATACPLTGIIPHEEMPQYYANIDIWVDRVGLGFYGFAAVEAAACGIPVITHIDEDIRRKHVRNCPFITVDRNLGVGDAIVRLVQDKELRDQLGKKNREYVAEVHDSITVARQCVRRYEQMLKVTT